MRRTLILIVLITLPLISFSQKGIGIRGIFGYSGGTFGGAAISYQDIGRFEINGAWNSQGMGLAGLKLFELVDANAVTVYSGIGGGIGTPDEFKSYQVALIGTLGMSVLLGPIQFSLDWRPEYEIIHPDSAPWRFNFGFAIRFMFPDKGD
ncbi:MAG: hypothetical protein ABFR62_08405 [Bacteroidota bacterium]